MFWTASVTPSDALRRALHKWGGAVSHMAASAALGAVVAAGLASSAVVQARTPDQPSAVGRVALVTLPAQAQTTHRLILSGGPFPYSKDGTVFGNRERLLPTKDRGFYREYTVKTPGSRDRGARRIVCGGKAPTQPDNCFYTHDHYASFSQIAP